MALADGERFERSTYGFKVRCSNNLSYPSTQSPFDAYVREETRRKKRTFTQGDAHELECTHAADLIGLIKGRWL